MAVYPCICPQGHLEVHLCVGQESKCLPVQVFVHTSSGFSVHLLSTEPISCLLVSTESLLSDYHILS